jgi:hypothetical protein
VDGEEEVDGPPVAEREGWGGSERERCLGVRGKEREIRSLFFKMFATMAPRGMPRRRRMQHLAFGPSDETLNMV